MRNDDFGGEFEVLTAAIKHYLRILYAITIDHFPRNKWINSRNNYMLIFPWDHCFLTNFRSHFLDSLVQSCYIYIWIYFSSLQRKQICLVFVDILFGDKTHTIQIKLIETIFIDNRKLAAIRCYIHLSEHFSELTTKSSCTHNHQVQFF